MRGWRGLVLVGLGLLVAWPLGAQDQKSTEWMSAGRIGAERKAIDSAANERAVAGRFRNLSIADGLPNPRVFAIDQDRDGFLWVGTQNGLGRFDGHEFRVFGGDGGGHSALPDGYITAIHAAADGGIWLGTHSGMLMRFDPERERSMPVAADMDPGCSRSTEAIVELESGEVFFGGGFGLYHLRPESKAVQLLPGEPCAPKVLNFALGRDGELWVAAASGLYSWRPGATELEQHESIGPLSTLCADADGDIILVIESGFARLDPLTRKVRPLEVAGWARSGALSCMVDRQGTLWLSKENLGEVLQPGLVAVSSDGSRLALHRPDRQLPGRPADSSYLSMFEDQQGVLWFGGVSHGLDRLDPRGVGFELLRSHPLLPSSLASNHVLSVAESTDSGDVWVGYFGAGLQRLDASRRPREIFSPGPGGPRSGHIWDLEVDGFGDLWIAHETGLDRLSAAGVFTSVAAEEIPLGRVLSVHQASTGRLWAATLDQLGYIEQQPEPTWHPSGHLMPAPVLALQENIAGDLWIGFDGTGLGHLDFESGTLRLWDEAALGHGVVSSLLLLDEDSLLLTTLGAGLISLDRVQGVMRRWTVADGLSSNALKAIVPAEPGVVWVTSEAAIDRIDLESGVVRSFDVAAGVPPLGFVTKASHAGNERLWFGSKNGLVSFSPEAVAAEFSAPKAALTWLEIVHRRVGLRPEDPSSPLSRALHRTASIELSHRDRVVSFGFTALDFGSPERQIFRYRLDGFDRDWVETDAAERLARYSNLPPGRFSFRVEASLDGKSWGEPAILAVRVRPPWWRSTFAYLIYGALVLSGLGWIYERQRRQVQRLGRLLPICASCKKIRDDEGYWQEVEAYVSSRSGALFSHGLCPICFDHSMAEIDDNA